MKRESIRHNFIMNALLGISGVAFPLISFRYASRILLPEGIGKVSFAISVIAYFSMFAELGIPTYGIRACARVRDDRHLLSRTVHELLGINLAMNLITYALLGLAIFFIPRMGEEKLLFGIISSVILLNSIGMEWLYKGLEEYTYITVRSLTFKVISLIALFLFIHQQTDYIIYGGISIFATSASNLLNFLHAGKYIDFRRPADCNWKKHLKPVLIFFGMACATTIYTNLDSAMLGFMTTDADVGFYNAAVKVKGILLSLITALGAVLLPRSTWYVEHGYMEEFRRITKKALSFILLAAPPVALFFILFAKESILLVSGEAFLPSVPAMQIILPTVFIIGLSNILGIQIMVPLGKEKAVLKSVIAGAIADLVLNLVFIPKYHAAGAAIGTLAAEMIVLAVQYIALREELKPFVRNYPWLQLLAALLLSAIACLWVQRMAWRPIWSLTAAAICFFGVYCLFQLWRGNETLRDCFQLIRQKIEKGSRRL